MDIRRSTIIAFFLITSTLSALDIRIGKGDFTATQGIAGLYSVSAEVDLDVISLDERHYALGDSGLFVFGNLDIYSSKQMDSMTDVIDSIMNTSTPTLPFETPITVGTTTPNEVLGTFIPVPSSYKMYGVDFDIGLGHDVIASDRGYIGLGIMTGISMPAMEMENYFESYNFYTELLSQTKTELTTYKLGLSIQGGYEIMDYLSVYGSGTYAYQFGEMDNSIVRSSVDAKGSYRAFDIGLRFYPLLLADDDKGDLYDRFYLNIGHAYKKWEVDEVQVSLIGIDMPDPMSYLDIGFESSYTYLGLGYRF